ncbi:MAG TPA: iron chelate uptake ABC transporter family permease subunit, partial [Thermoanaerobaculia bacterium]|nr:iron chelate uptake ABC transporter family permease subunit [Thermoanaerobaculia bacterium]
MKPFLILSILLAISVVIALSFGAAPISWRALLDGDEIATAIFFRLRLPRVLLGALVGATLATAGVTFQTLLRNPLADPF